VRRALGAEAADHLLGFISIGTIVETPIPSRRPTLAEMLDIFDAEGLRKK
jgi:hypothetical protein